jgi:hypothetical protein
LEWRLHRERYAKSALIDLLGVDAAFDRWHDRLLAHRQAAFDHLVGRWRDLFNASVDVLPCHLTSTCFEANPPSREATSAASLLVRLPQRLLIWAMDRGMPTCGA